VGEHYFQKLTDREIRISSGFAGGVGGTEQELCGVFSMGVAVISGLYGRTSEDIDDQDCQDLVAKFRQQFLDRFGTLRCKELRESGFGSDDQPCAVLAERGVRVLLEVIEDYQLQQSGEM
jgi:C_GCAxxG_C_C family probable redox protein